MNVRMGNFNIFKKKKMPKPKRLIDATAQGQDSLFEDAVRQVVQEHFYSKSRIELNLHIDYEQATRIEEELETTGVIGANIEPMIPREVLVSDEESLYGRLAPLCSVIPPIPKASILGVSRLRMGTDGNGITTLVAFHGCSLGCAYCLNPKCRVYDKNIKRMSAMEVMDLLRKDELYYIATKGGVTFGGGEPFLNSMFIKEVLDLGAKEWNVTVETSLNVPKEYIEPLLPYIDEYIVDVKDMDDTIYRRYTRRSNELMKSNLKWLVDIGYADRIICRIPLISGYNNEKYQKKSKEKLIKMGISRFDLFTYKTDRV